MAQILVNPFDHRQTMKRENYEIFHYNNPETCTCPLHQHDFYELFCLLDDGLDYIVEGLRYTMKPGSIILITPGQLHRADVPGPVRDIDRFVLWLNAEYVRALTGALPHFRYTLLGDMTGRNLIQPDDDTGATMRQLLYALQRECARDDAESAQLSRSIVTQLLIYCSRCVTRAPETLPRRAELRYHEIMRVYGYILTHLQEDLSVAGLAEMFFMDKNTLTRQFKLLVGMTPGECIRHNRLEAARQMILSGVTMQQACAECGFSDYSAFYRAFRGAYGVSPSAVAAADANAPGGMAVS